MTKAYNISCYECDVNTNDTSAYWIMDTIGKNTSNSKGFENLRIFQCYKCRVIITLEITN